MAHAHAHGDRDWLHAHAHEPNPQPPSADPTLVVVWEHGARQLAVQPADLRALPRTAIPGCFIVSTGHGTSGPFTFGGVRLLDVVRHAIGARTAWHVADVISADGFGTRVTAAELEQDALRPILLADELDGAPLTRQQGLARLIVPSETGDALRQVKWIARIEVDPPSN
jgi:DMSO/TMAO reductase YedYZ molybdopterin-dependent catalytic subunit